MRTVIISEEPIELYKLLKFESLVSSGGEAKHVVSEGLVWLNGRPETQKRKLKSHSRKHVREHVN